MERIGQEEFTTLADVLRTIEKETVDAFGSISLALFITHDYRFNGLHNLTTYRGERHSRWVEDSAGINREVSTFPGGSWQIKTTFEHFDKDKGVSQLNILASKDPSGKITVEGQLPVTLVKSYLLDTSSGQVDEYRGLLFKTLELIKSKVFAVQFKLTNREEISFIGLPL